jgi:hypothetical protein
MDRIVIFLPNEKIKTYQILILLIGLINIIMLSMFKLRMDNDSFTSIMISGFIGATIAPILLWIFSKKNKDFQLRSMIASTLISSVVWFLIGNVLVGISLILLSLLAFKTIRKLMVVFDDSGILYPTFPVKKFNWNEVDNLMLKADVLTIDLKNNQLLQFTIHESENPELDADAFNKFATEKLLKVQKV